MSGECLPDVVRALLVAARVNGLALAYEPHGTPLCFGSREPGRGWYASASWNNRHPDYAKGGPWSVETVMAACELGLVGVDPANRDRACLTKAGRAALKQPVTPNDGALASTKGERVPTSENGESQ